MQIKDLIKQEQRTQLEDLLFKLESNYYCDKHNISLDVRYYAVKGCYHCKHSIDKKNDKPQYCN